MSVFNKTLSATYQHHKLNGEPFELPLGKVVCVGRNYIDHIEELNNQVSDIPLLFMKPSTAIVDMQQAIEVPTDKGECHNELEIALLIGSQLSNADIGQASEAIVGVGLGLDLTLRDEQNRLKANGQPWERAKSFDGSCPLSPFIKINSLEQNAHFQFQLLVNGEVVQSGDTTLMLTPMLNLVCEISKHFTLLPGDVVLTGTPKGVGPLHAGDTIEAKLKDQFSISTQVICSARGTK
jgi:2-keto-4-pentenoate hydratase/2-oxohepta-3-ene-1,7-dioic acid hydratase in catechol pathway